MTAAADFGRLLEILLPRGGYIAVTIEAYFDESGTHGGSPFLCVAGYLFEANKARSFDVEWRAMLADFDLPYFHRAPCEAGDPPFDKLDDVLRRAIRTRAIGIILKHVTHGLVVALDPRAYERIVPKHTHVGDAYTFCATSIFNSVKEWGDRRRFHGKIAYFFEAGAKNQRTANELMAAKAASERGQAWYRYQSHTFLQKEHSTPLQAADVLAWHYRDHCMRAERKGAIHPEFSRLIKNTKTGVVHLWDSELYDVADAVRATVAECPDADPAWEDRPGRPVAVKRPSQTRDQKPRHSRKPRRLWRP